MKKTLLKYQKILIMLKIKFNYSKIIKKNKFNKTFKNGKKIQIIQLI